MKRTALLAACLVAGAAQAENYRWEHVVQVDAVDITVKELTDSEMRDVKRQYAGGRQAPEKGLWAARKHMGFAVLFRAGDTFRCVIHVLDASDADTIKHERRHCYGWTH